MDWIVHPITGKVDWVQTVMTQVSFTLLTMKGRVKLTSKDGGEANNKEDLVILNV